MVLFLKKLFFKKFEFEKDGKRYLYFEGKEIEIKPMDMGKLTLVGKGGVVG